MIVEARRGALPSLLICGGSHCGTTPMFQALTAHPAVFGPTGSIGVHYFDLEGERDLDWYRSHFPSQEEIDRAGHRHRGSALCIESSPYYLFHPRAAEQIAEDLPGVRVLVMVRDPVERAHLAHARQQALGREDLAFAEAVDHEDDRLRGEVARLYRDPGYRSHAHRYQSYCGSGEYAPRIERFAALLGRDRVKVIESACLGSSPVSVLADLWDWLGVSWRDVPPLECSPDQSIRELDADLRAELSDRFLAFDMALAPWLGHAPTWRQ